MKELGILQDSNHRKSNIQNKRTYKRLKTKPSVIVKRHATYMHRHDISLVKSQLKLPFLYWTPKMHYFISKQRYIAASYSCSTKPLSKLITFALKLVQQTHTNHCKKLFQNCGYNRMWIVDNSIKVNEQITELN